MTGWKWAVANLASWSIWVRFVLKNCYAPWYLVVCQPPPSEGAQQRWGYSLKPSVSTNQHGTRLQGINSGAEIRIEPEQNVRPNRRKNSGRKMSSSAESCDNLNSDTIRRNNCYFSNSRRMNNSASNPSSCHPICRCQIIPMVLG